MKSRIIKLLTILLFSFFPFFCVYAYDEGYEIEKYDVNINVLENHKLEITETIDVNFKESRHGIKRNIPTVNNYKRVIDNEEVNVEAEAKISNYSVNEQYVVENSYHDLVLKIGDPDKIITGNKKYIIKYDYDYGEDYLNTFDDLYHNIIGTNWDCYIKNVTFTINMPKDFDESKINFTIGRYGATYNNDIIYNIENNTISGYIKDVKGYALYPYEGLTVRVELPEGYYVNEEEYKWLNDPRGDYYDIEKLDVVATLKENNVMHVEEKYTIKNNKDNSSIYRRIKIKGTIDRKIDDKIRKQLIDYRISNVKSNLEIYEYKYDDDYVISNRGYGTLKDEVYDYNISYDIDFGDDLVDSSDLFLYNFKNMYAPVKEFNFLLNLPKEIDSNNIHILKSDSSFDSTYDRRKVLISYEDNKLNVSFKKNYFGYSIDKIDDVIVKIDLDEGYFVNERQIVNKGIIKIKMRLILLIVLLFISIIIYLLFGLRIKKPHIVYYTSPDDLSPAEVGYIYKGKVKNKHIISLIIYFANKGYLNIESEKRNFTLIKKKNISNNEPGYAVTTFNGLFKHGSSKTTKKDLENSFYSTLDSAKLKLKKTHKIYSASHSISIFIYYLILFIAFIVKIVELSFKNTYVFTNDMIFYDNLFMIIYRITQLLCIIFILFFKKMTKEETDNYYKIKGFRDFLKHVEKDKLETLVEEMPTYFYDILPYAYVLGISRKWAKKFEFIPLEEANWYKSNYNGMFNAIAFTRSFSSTISHVSAASSSRPYQSTSSGYSGGGSFSGGGGSSGGGGGGGGGSSW